MTGNRDAGDWLTGSGRAPGNRVIAFATWLPERLRLGPPSFVVLAARS
jgi:hypothetical protein